MASQRADPGKNIVTALVADLVKNDVSKFDAQTVAALNKVCGGGVDAPSVTTKVIKISMGVKTAKYSHNSRLQIDLAPGLVLCIWNVGS